MKLIPILLASLFLSFGHYYAQCPMDLLFETQLQIDNFSTDHPGCSDIPGNLTIVGTTLTEIKNLDGLSTLLSIGGNLTIENNDNLTTIAGLSNISSIGGNISLINLDDLTSISALSNLTSVTGNLVLNFINGLNGLTGLNTISSITGDLELKGLNNLISLSSLSNLNSIGGDLIIDFNFDLTDLVGLEGIATVNALEIISNTKLTSLTGLNNLTTVSSSIKINNNNSLLNFTGLDNLVSNGSFLQILNNPAITNFTGLGSFTTAGGQFWIGTNALLNSMSGLSSLNTINGQFNFTNNSNIMNLSGLESLTSIGGQLEITGNSNLNSLIGLQNLSTLIGDINVIGNSSLTFCSVSSICSFIVSPPGTLTFSANATGCSSLLQVETACSPAPVELIEFKANSRMGVVSLEWVTASEANNKGFEIEYSQDGSDFRTLGFIAGAGDSETRKEYKFNHNNPFKGKNFYRLRQIDYDDSFEYSQILSVKNQQDRLSFYPNPTNGNITIAGYLPEVYSLVVSNLQGEEVLKTDNFSGKTIKMDGLKDGIYIVQVFDRHRPEVFKVLLKRE